MKSSVLSYCLGLTTLLLLGLGYVKYAYNLGFPDEYISEYSRICRTVYYVLACPVVVLPGYFFFLGRSALAGRRKKKLVIALVALGVCVVTMLVVDKIAYIHLDHGQGG